MNFVFIIGFNGFAGACGQRVKNLRFEMWKRGWKGERVLGSMVSGFLVSD
ncbi:MAG: hypothetical protein ACT6FF_02615 [Methanosarcinaceae archaeon]